LTFLKRTNSFVEFASGLKKLQIEADQLEVGMGEELSFDDSWYNYTDIRYYFDNLNDKQFAMKGSKIKAFASISLPLSGNSSPDNNAIAIGLNLDYLKIIRLTSNFSIGLDLNAGISLFDSNPSMTYHFATANKKLVNNIKPFPGLEFGQASGETALKIGILTRLKPSENIFISLRGDGLWLGDPINNIVTSKSQIYGASIGLGYKSIIGPLELIYGQTNQGEKLYFNLGYWF
jgi:outer membrane protein assembly factor BamA